MSKIVDALHKKYLTRTYSASSVPDEWANEVFDLLSSIDKDFGIKYPTEDDMSIFYSRLLSWIFIHPLYNAYYTWSNRTYPYVEIFDGDLSRSKKLTTSYHIKTLVMMVGRRQRQMCIRDRW